MFWGREGNTKLISKQIFDIGLTSEKTAPKVGEGRKWLFFAVVMATARGSGQNEMSHTSGHQSEYTYQVSSRSGQQFRL